MAKRKYAVALWHPRTGQNLRDFRRAAMSSMSVVNEVIGLRVGMRRTRNATAARVPALVTRFSFAAGDVRGVLAESSFFIV